MSTVFSEDFETDLSAWTLTGTPTLEAGQGFAGSQGLRSDLAGERSRMDGLTLDNVWCGFWFKAAGSSSSIATLCSMLAEGAFLQSAVRYRNSDGYMDVVNQADAVMDSVNPSGVEDGEWHFIEFFCFCDNSGQSIVHVDGVEVLNGSGDTRGLGGPPINNIGLHGHAADNARLFDDFYVDDSEFHGMPSSFVPGYRRMSGGMQQLNGGV